MGDSSKSVARGEGKPFSTVRLVTWILPTVFQTSARVAGYAAYQLSRKMVSWRCDGNRKGGDIKYLTKVLKQKGHLSPNQVVSKVTRTPIAKGAIGVLDRLHLVVVDTNTKEETLMTIVSKSLGTFLPDVLLNVILRLNERECATYMYEPLIPDELRTCGLMPTCFDAYVSWFGVGYILLEDLSALRMIKPIVGVTKNDAVLMLEAIAHTHSLTWCDQELALKTQMHIRIFDCLLPVFVEKLLSNPSWKTFFEARPHFVRCARALQNENFFNNLLKVVSGYKYHEMLTPSNIGEYYCLTHGDARLDNCFFDDEKGEAKFIDWQVSIPHHPGTDVAWVFMEVQTEYFQFPSQDRYNGLLEEYHSRLSGHLEKRGNTKNVIPLEKFKADFPWMLVGNTHYLVAAIIAVFKEDNVSAPAPLKQGEHAQTTDTAALRCYVDRTNAQLEAMVPISFFEGY
jgi:hypothetical protein